MTDTEGGARTRDGAPRRAAAPRRNGARRALAQAPAGTSAVLLATADADGGGPAAALPWEGATVLRRLLGQLADLGIRTVDVITRPGWEGALQPSTAGVDATVSVHASPTPADDLRAVAGIAGERGGALLVAHADIVTHREALAGLLADPRLATAILVTAGWQGRPFALRSKSLRGRVISASSAFHYARAANTGFLGVIKVAPGDRAALAKAAESFAELRVRDVPDEWAEELEYKSGNWRVWLWKRMQADAAEAEGATREQRRAIWAEPVEPSDVTLPPELEHEVRRRTEVARGEVASLLLVGLVRGGTHVGNSYLRRLFWARPLSLDAIDRAAEDITEYDEDRVLLESAVKANDGFFTTFFVSPYSKYIARWTARRGLTPNVVTTISLGIGVCAAVAFGAGTRAGLIAGAVLLQVAFTTDCVDGQLARYTRTFSKLGAWLDSVFDRAKEYVVFAGLAIGASRAGHGVWLLAGAALTLQTVRHTIEFSFAATRHRAIAAVKHPALTVPHDVNGPRPKEPASVAKRRAAERELTLPERVLALWRRLERIPGVIWAKKMIAFPIGERFAAISLTAALWTPRTTFLVLLVWGGVAGVYTLAGRVLRSI